MRYNVIRVDGKFYHSYSKQVKDALRYATDCAESIGGSVVDEDTGKQVWPKI